MADKENAALTAAAALDGSELLPIVQGANSRKTTTQDVADLGQTYVDNAIALVSGSGNTAQDGIVSGCGVAYTGTGLTFDMSAGTFYLDGDQHTAAAQSITLTAADATNPRIDVLFVDDTGTLGKVTGTAAASPSQPSIDPTTQLYLTFVLVPATATSLSGITNEDIYKEGTEWTGTTSGSGFTLNSTNNPFAGTKDIEGTAVTGTSYVKLVRASPLSFDGDGNLTLRIRSKAGWSSKRWLTLRWFTAGVAKGVTVSLKSGSFGFDSTITSGYQLVVIPKSLFAVPAGTSVDELRITDAGGPIGFYLDDIILQNVGASTGGGTVSGITQEQADARYLKQTGGVASGDISVPDEVYGGGWNGSLEVPTKNAVYDKIESVVAGGGLLAANNLSDVGSVPTARDNLGAAPKVMTIEPVSGTTYTFATADSYKHKRFTNGSAVTATVPKNASDAIPIGTRVRWTAAGAGQVTLTPEDGTVTLNSRGGALKSGGQYAVGEIEKVGTNEWDVLGDVTT